MKKTLLSLTTILALANSTLLYAESYPANGELSYKNIDETNYADRNKLYLGVGYSYADANLDIPAFYLGNGFEFDIQSDNINLVAGYELNRYFAFEARYTFSATDLDFTVKNGYGDEGMTWGGDLSNLGLYIKPKYQSGAVAVYALLGYGHVRLDIDNIGDHSENEFQWGLGVSMDVGSSIIADTDTYLFLDYMRLYDDEMSQIKFKIDTVTAGIAFKF